MSNASKKTNVSSENIHVTNLPLVPMLTLPLNALVLTDTTVLVSVSLMAVADVSILTNATMELQLAQTSPLAKTMTEAMVAIVTLVTRNPQMVTMCARMSMNVPAMMSSHMIAFQKLIARTPMVLSHVPVKQDSMTSMVTVVFVSKLMNALMRLTTVTN